MRIIYILRNVTLRADKQKESVVFEKMKVVQFFSSNRY